MMPPSSPSLSSEVSPFLTQDLVITSDLPDTVAHILLGAQQWLRGDEEGNIGAKEVFLHLDWAKDFVWERLHTGHWSEVDAKWTHAFAVVHLLKVAALCKLGEEVSSCSEVSLLPDLVKLCDVGILMGSPLKGNPLDKLATIFSKRFRALNALKKEEEPPSKKVKLEDIPVPTAAVTGSVSVRPLPVKSDVGLESFLLDHKLPRVPLLLRGEMSDWPAMTDRRWTTDRLEEVAGLRLVPVELGRRYTDDQWTQTLMSVSEFIQKYVRSTPGKKEGEKGYLAQHDLLDQVQELKEDVYVPEYCHTAEDDNAEEVKINAWFGPAGTVSPLHYDPRHNLFGQVFGRKYVRLYHENQSRNLYPFPETTMITNTSQVDLESEHVTREHPLFSEAEGWEVILEPGDMLYIPPRCWHFVKSLEESCSVNFWFD